MKQDTTLCQRLYRKYLQGPDHLSKLRVLRLLERHLIPENGAVFDVDAGFKMVLHPRDYLEYQLIRTGIYEPLTLQFMIKNLFNGKIVLLAGVNIGLHVMVASRRVGNTGCVVGVEPQPTSLHRTLCNISLNDLPANIKLVSGALGSTTAIVPMPEASPNDTGCASFVLFDAERYPYYIQIDTVPAILSRLKLTHIDLMLLDVEGYELPVLEAMVDGPKPSILVLEVHPRIVNRIGSNEQEYYSMVRTLGYECYNFFGETVQANDQLPENNMIAVFPSAIDPKWLERI